MEFPIVPSSLVKLTSVFLASLLVSTVWVTVTLFTSGSSLCLADGSLGTLTSMERFIHGWSLAFSLACSMWIIVIGIKGYRHRPKVDKVVLEALVEGMSKNPGLERTEACSE